MSQDLIRVTEWSNVKPDLTSDCRTAISEAANNWRVANRLKSEPIRFEGPDGRTLAVNQYVGVVCAGGVTVEIYPKLDKLLVGDTIVKHDTRSVMSNLLWMLHVADRQSVYDADSGTMADMPDAFIDVFALLLARNLMAELQRGLSRRYIHLEDDLRTVRGRLMLRDQLVRNYDRFDRISCAWDELTSDTPLFQLLKCACRELQHLVRDSATRQLLTDCTFALDEVSDVSIESALSRASHTTWDRINERYRRCFDLACRLLRGTGHALRAGDSDTFVFLIDMSELFQEYVQAIIEATFETAAERQKDIGRLLVLPKGGVGQFADYIWTTGKSEWIGDAKYKHLAAGQEDCLEFHGLFNDEETNNKAAGRVLSPDDIRQLTVYGELRRRKSGRHSRLAIFYPFIGSGSFACHHVDTWSGTTLGLVPCKVTRHENIASLMPILLA